MTLVAERTNLAVPSINFTTSEPCDVTDFDDAMEFFNAYGMVPDEFQANILINWLARDPDNDLWVHSHAGLSIPRQNGKSFLLELRIIFGLVFLNERIIFASHELRSAEAIYNRLISFFEDDSKPEIKALVKRISRTNGKQFIEMKDGGIVHFLARTKGSGRGMTVDLLVLDECQALTSESYAAMQPTTSATPNPQTIMVGTPPIPDTDFEIFGNFRQAAIKGEATNLTWTEYSAQPGDDPNDEDLWFRTVPALSTGRISVETVRGELAMFPEEVFMRERLGVWGNASGTSVIPVDSWTGLANDKSKIVSDHVLAIDLSPNRASATLAVAGKSSTGATHVEVIDSRLGVGWVIDRTLEVAQRNNIKSVVIDGAGPAATEVEPLRKARLRVTTTNSQDMKNACGMLLDAVNQHELVHVNQPPLNLSVANARKRTLGDGFAFARSTPTADLTPLVAITLAHWGIKTSKVKKTKDGTTKAHNRRRAHILR